MCDPSGEPNPFEVQRHMKPPRFVSAGEMGKLEPAPPQVINYRGWYVKPGMPVSPSDPVTTSTRAVAQNDLRLRGTLTPGSDAIVHMLAKVYNLTLTAQRPLSDGVTVLNKACV